MATLLSCADVQGTAHRLPAFPRVVEAILATLDDPEASLMLLTDHVQHDPVLTGRILAVANTAARRTHHISSVKDIYTAIALIGTERVRNMVITAGLGGFFAAIPEGAATDYWRHSVAVGVCCEELAGHVAAPLSVDQALIAGLLHDIGQLWLLRQDSAAMHDAWRASRELGISIEDAERERFGAEHGTIGAWLAEYWQLPAGIVAAIRHHHDPDAALDLPLVPLTHVAEVLANALDLADRHANRVSHVSAAACARLGLAWSAASHTLFGRIEARSRHANAFFA